MGFFDGARAWWSGGKQPQSLAREIAEILSDGMVHHTHPESGEPMYHHILSRESVNGVADTYNALKLYIYGCGQSSKNVPNHEGLPPLSFAINNGCHESLVWLLIEGRVQCNFPDVYFDLTPYEIFERVKNSFDYSGTLERFLSSGVIYYEHDEGTERMSEYFLRERAVREAYVIDGELKLRDALASKPTLRGFKIDLAGVSFRDKHFSGSDFSGADLRGIDFSGAFLYGVNFSKADLRGTKFVKAALEGVIFSETDLRWVDLSGLSLDRAVFLQPKLKGANLSGASLREAEFRVVDLTRTGCSLDQFEFVKSLEAVAFRDIGKITLTEHRRIRYHNSGRLVDSTYFFKKSSSIPGRLDTLSRSGSSFENSPTKSQLEQRDRVFKERRVAGSQVLHVLIDEANKQVRVDVDEIKKVLSDYHEIIDMRENCVLSEEVHDNSATVLYKAVDGGKVDVVEVLLGAGADPNLPCGDRAETPLFQAALNGNLQCIKALVRGGASLDVKNFQGQTPLQLAREYNMRDSVRLLEKLKSEESFRMPAGEEDWVVVAAASQPIRRRHSPAVSLDFDKEI